MEKKTSSKDSRRTLLGRSYDNTPSIASIYASTTKITTRINSLLLPNETPISTCDFIRKHDPASKSNKMTRDNLVYFSSSGSGVSQDDHFINSNMSEDSTTLADFDDINYPLDIKEDLELPLAPNNSPLWRKDLVVESKNFTLMW